MTKERSIRESDIDKAARTLKWFCRHKEKEDDIKISEIEVVKKIYNVSNEEIVRRIEQW